MRQSGPFEYQDLKEVAKWDSECEIPGEDGMSTRWNSGCDGHSDALAAKRSSGSEAPG